MIVDTKTGEILDLSALRTKPRGQVHRLQPTRVRARQTTYYPTKYRSRPSPLVDLAIAFSACFLACALLFSTSL